MAGMFPGTMTLYVAELYSLFTHFLLYSYILYTGHIRTYWCHYTMHLLTVSSA